MDIGVEGTFVIAKEGPRSECREPGQGVLLTQDSGAILFPVTELRM